MTKAIHNWPALKKEFFDSEYLEVTPFLVAKGIAEEGGRIGGNAEEKTNGWKKEKSQWAVELFEKAKKAAGEHSQMEWEKILIGVDAARRMLIHKILDIVNTKATLDELAVKEIIALMKGLKEEAGETEIAAMDTTFNLILSEVDAKSMEKNQAAS